MSIYMISFKEMVNKRIDEFLNVYKKQYKDGTGIAMLALKLEKDPSGIGEMIVAEPMHLKDIMWLYSIRRQCHMGLTTYDQINTEDLKEKFNKFNDLYRRLIKENLQECGPNITLLINNAKIFIGKIEQKPDSVKWDAKIRNKVPELMAYIFAVWTLQNAHFYFDAKGVQDQNSYLLQPHVAQIIAIFRMLGIDKNKGIIRSLQKKIDEKRPRFISGWIGSKPRLVSNLVQIGTGEGKSITLAVASCVLALLGFDVSCASYSEYLSRRDFKSFEPLFNAFGVVDHIHYDTFNKLCERIINEGGDVRKLVENLIIPDDEKESVETSRVTRAKSVID
ncbi:hypothetical protein RFI_22460 [Reticulomyxa filosa]|uniref:SecA DEAD-like N-terminal domain-containing protein n=1 Tax=Reticulomyxa filosa TaxID=46433 RepID=X6MLP6_RETFI|nr:hypothetical protein RFI_22460 [Reticulomyxa filosa]|eukprot:ETO14908.1 hypothetical protein RFI_22460 [Reticulomyxa filosa]